MIGGFGWLVRLGVAASLWASPPAEPVGDAPEQAPAPAQAPEPAAAAPAGPAAAPAPAEVAPITVTTRLTPDPARIGDLLTLEVIVAYPRDHAINLPNGLDFAPLELVEIEPGPVESSGKDLRQRFTITLQHFDVGETAVPSFPVTWVDPRDQVHTYAVAAHPFVVESLLANESDPQPRGPDPMISLEYANVRLAEILVAALGGVLLAVALVIAFVLLRRRDKPIYVPPPVPPHERAFADLERLARDREALIAEGAYQDYYLRLTEIAKRYLGARFEFEALDRTTEEIQALLTSGRVRVDPLDPKAVMTFLQDCDLVKFARLSPPAQETLDGLGFVRGMVEQTRAVAAEPEPSGKSAPATVGAQRPAVEPAPDPNPEPPTSEAPR
jgi:hypothetical protein